MNTPPTLDSFETALLAELRAHVATRPATEPAPEPRRRHPRRWAAGLAAAAAVATAYVVASPGGPSPAYAISENSHGDVVVTVHRLEDSAGLESALRAHGIDATVDFNPSSGEGPTSFRIEDGQPTDAPPPPGGTVERRETGKGGPQLDQHGEGGPVTQVEPGDLPDRIDPDACGPTDQQPATLTHEDDDWVLRIPADSILQDRPVRVTTGADGMLAVFYKGTEPGMYCGMASIDN